MERQGANEDDSSVSKKQRKDGDDITTVSGYNHLNMAPNRSRVLTDQSLADDATDDHGKNQSSNVERKRVREQKRRSDITNAIDLLVQVLLEIDIPIVSSAISHDKQNFPSDLSLNQASMIMHASTSAGGSNPARTSRIATQHLPYNRSEIISYAKQVLERIHNENIALKHEVECLKNVLSTQQLSQQSRADLIASTGTLQVAGTRERSNVPISATQDSPQSPINQLLASFLSILLSNGCQNTANQVTDTSISGHSYHTDSQYLPSITHHGSNSQSTRSLNQGSIPTVHQSEIQLRPQASYENFQALRNSSGSPEAIGAQDGLNTHSIPRDTTSNEVFLSEADIQRYLPLFSSSVFQSLPIDQQIALFNQLLLNTNGVGETSTVEDGQKTGPDRPHIRK